MLEVCNQMKMMRLNIFSQMINANYISRNRKRNLKNGINNPVSLFEQSNKFDKTVRIRILDSPLLEWSINSCKHTGVGGMNEWLNK